MRPSILLSFALLFVGCSQPGNGYGYSTSSPAAAVAATGVVVAATGINRALTGECWARCSPGWACNRESGLCQQVECRPSCSATQRCVVTTENRLECVPEGLAFGNQSSTATTANSTPSVARPGSGAPTPPSGPGPSSANPPFPTTQGTQ